MKGTVSISIHNTKLGVIPSVSLPPLLSCRKDAPCFKDCYARKGNFRFKNVIDALQRNWEIYKRDSSSYFGQIKEAIDNGFVIHKFFRWHSSGDIPDKQYFEGVVDVAKNCKNTSFLIFSKQFEIINKYVEDGETIPKNLNIVFSAWGAGFPVLNPYNFPVAYVRLPDQDCCIPDDAQDCNGNCMKCLKCWTIKRGESVAFKKH